MPADGSNTTPAPIALTLKGALYCTAYDLTSALLANAMLAATLFRRRNGPAAVETRNNPAKPAPAAARERVLA